METISIKEMADILKSIHIRTLEMYLNNYRFNKYRVMPMSCGINARFFISRDFLNTLYTLLWIRNRVKEAEKLKKHFSLYNIKAIEWEDFVCENKA